MRPSSPLVMIALALALASGCAPGRRSVEVARMAGWAGWFQVHTAPTAGYGGRFEGVPLGLTSPPCDDIASHVERAEGPVYVLVHGIKGDGPEWHDVVPALSAASPSSVWMYRWVAYDERDAIVERLGMGLTRLLQCLPEAQEPVIVLAHSAGGIVASKAASRMAIPATRPATSVQILTVASPLAGTVERERNLDGSSEARFLLDLGTAIEAYPPPARGVAVAHLRTAAPADTVMAPGRSGRVPNDPSVGVPGAPQVELPDGLGHDEALLWVARQVAADTWRDLLPEE